MSTEGYIFVNFRGAANIHPTSHDRRIHNPAQHTASQNKHL
ncbi:Protein of unknown function [Pyronema omphalodes CBS 100304]|uniref:Uncharacterized protein n=1 Tax=Pyronema omphalodes (strain CBS 100304) TaxID=1076935 RepID=U4LVL5_PYROM|nr:Protein of unknown function [Pyronema omphalodes CBS 100304]